nr:DUF4189 domain-containing protein [Xanthomonas cannabis]
MILVIKLPTATSGLNMNLRPSYSFLCLLLMTGAAYAEGQCPPGFYPIGGQGASGCAPIGGGDSGGSPQPSGEWRKRWGAFAMDGSLGVLGATSKQKSKAEAKKLALKSCLDLGGRDCKISFIYNNQCAAVARSLDGGGSTIQGAPSADDAKATALSACEENSRIHSCEVIYAECSMSEFRSY